MATHRTIAALLILGTALLASGCQEPFEYDLRLGPYLDLLAAEPTSATIGWEDAYPEATGYRLERREENKSNFKNISGDLTPDVKQYPDTGLDPDKKYFYRLRAKFKGGGLARSVILKVFAEDRAEPTPTKRLEGQASPTFGEIPYLGSVPGEPRLSPDGATLAWAEAGRVLLMDTTSGEIRPSTPPSGRPARGVAFTPDGLGLVVAVGRSGAESLLLLGLHSGAWHEIAGPGRGGTDPDVSPDGARVVFVRDEGIFEIGIRGGRPELLVLGAVAKPRWSPGGSRLAFLALPGRSPEVLVARRVPPGTLAPATRVGGGAAGAGPLVWSPDGTTLAFSGESGGVIFLPVTAEATGGGR